MISKNRLLNFNKIIYQNDDWFKFSLDSVLLSNFVTLNLRAKKVIDLATGNAPIPMLLYEKTKADIYGIELQKCVYDLALKSVLENGLNKRINLINGDIRNISSYFSSEIFDVVLCNPPYFNTISSDHYNKNRVKSIARHEIFLKLEDVLKASKYLLKAGGNFAMVHRSERFVEIISLMRKYNIEPKRVQFNYPKADRNSDLFLIEGTKNGKYGMKILPGLVIHNDDGSYTDFVKCMFGD